MTLFPTCKAIKYSLTSTGSSTSAIVSSWSTTISPQPFPLPQCIVGSLYLSVCCIWSMTCQFDLFFPLICHSCLECLHKWHTIWFRVIMKITLTIFSSVIKFYLQYVTIYVNLYWANILVKIIKKLGIILGFSFSSTISATYVIPLKF